MVYIVCFALSFLFAWLANNKAKNKVVFVLFSVLSISVVVALAGLRDFSIGIDTDNYLTMKLYWDGAIKSATLKEYIFDYIGGGYTEPFFALLIGVIAQMTGNFRLFLFIAHLIIILGIYIGAFRLRKHINPEWVLIIFYLLFFNQSLNIIRQYMAMAIVFAFFADILERKYIRYSIVVIIAIQFHIISIVAFGLLLIHFLFYAPVKLGTPFQRKIAFVSVLGVGVLSFKPLVRFAIDVGLLHKKYDFIFERDKSPAIIVMGMLAISLATTVIFRKEMRQKSQHYDYMQLCSLCYFVLLFLTFFVGASKRIALYFGMTDMVTMALIESAQTDKKKKWLVRAGILGMTFIYWFYIYVFRNASETIPYVFGFCS